MRIAMAGKGVPLTSGNIKTARNSGILSWPIKDRGREAIFAFSIRKRQSLGSNGKGALLFAFKLLT